ncbi:MAG: hypothetical protein RMK18_11340 [Armatimonadota bacterium]|nr:hypothetical protein [Armatimonadota bacterium]MCX7778279.1 hypothetical protein [Armatimonadota bacterium]MDW8026442.1 hypothetical protein [Armatimonadota bacterium]
MNAVHDEPSQLSHLSTFWFISCVLHALILLMPIKVMLPRMAMSTAIEVARIESPIVVEWKMHTRQVRHITSSTQTNLRSRVGVMRKPTHADMSQQTKAEKRISSSTSSSAKVIFKSSQVEIVRSRRVQSESSLAAKKTSEPRWGKTTTPLTNIQVGTLPRRGATYEAPSVNDASYNVGIKRAGSEVATQIDVPTLGEKVAKGLREGSGNLLTARPVAEDVRRQPQGGTAKHTPTQLGLVMAQPTARSVSSAGGESEGGYGVIALARSRDPTTSFGSTDELDERPELAGRGKPLSSSTTGLVGDSPVSVTRSVVGRGKSTPMVSELIGALAQTGEGGSVASGSQKQLRPQPRVAEPVAKEPQTKGYTGLIVDARGLKVERSMSPKVYDERGRVVYGSQMVPVHFAIEKGIVYYYTALEGALKDPRAGPKPLIVKAIGVRGSARQDVIVSVADGETILRENEVGHFLKRCNVIFVID